MLKNIKLVLLLFITGFTTSIVAHGDEAHMDYTSKAKTMIDSGEKYHKDVSLIIKMHPEFMDHKRDKTLREGVRSEEASLKSCVNCHGGFDKNNNPIRIDEKGQFCADCHDKVGTSVDCFGCHKATPKNKVN